MVKFTNSNTLNLKIFNQQPNRKLFLATQFHFEQQRNVLAWNLLTLEEKAEFIIPFL